VGQAAPAPQQEPPRTGGAYWYTRYGCSACHGQNGLGTLIGPPIVGLSTGPLSDNDIVLQVRSPADLMPDYPPAVLSDERLQAIIAHIRTLEPAR
jgi:mono/diheme cytochrome c family protein